MKRSAFCVALAMVICFLSGCAKYETNDFIGKTSVEIEAQYGKFDCCLMPPDADGLYRNCRCGYTIHEPRVGFWGTDPEILFFIHFDENGIAHDTSEGYRPGG